MGTQFNKNRTSDLMIFQVSYELRISFMMYLLTFKTNEVALPAWTLQQLSQLKK